MIEWPLLEPACALGHRAPIGAADTVRVAEIRFASLAIVRGEADALAGPVRATLGLDLPREPCTAAVRERDACLWIGPDAWMLVSHAWPDDLTARRAEALPSALAGTHHAVVDLSDQIALLALEGERARDLLSKLVPLDMHARAFRPGEVKGTVLGATTTHLWCRAQTRFCLTLRRSYADYGWCLLARAGREWGLEEPEPLGAERLTIGE